MPSKLEEVVNQIAKLQQMRSAGTLSESDYIGLKEEVLQKALPGNRGPGPAALDTSLPYSDRDGAQDATGLKRLALVSAVVAVIAAPLVTASYFHLVTRTNVPRAARSDRPAPPRKAAPPAPVPARAQALAPAQQDAEAAPVPDTENKIVAPQPPALSDAAHPMARRTRFPPPSASAPRRR